MRKPRLRTPHISLSSWSRLGLAAGLLVVFGSMIISLFETQALSASYEQADAARRIDVDNDSFRLGLFEQQAGINAYANDARALSEQVYVDGQQLAGNVLSQFQAAAQAEQLSVEVSRVVVTAQVWQAGMQCESLRASARTRWVISHRRWPPGRRAATTVSACSIFRSTSSASPVTVTSKSSTHPGRRQPVLAARS